MDTKKKKGMSMMAAARIILCEATTIGKEAIRIKNGEKPLSEKKSVRAVAKLFASGKPVTEEDVLKAALLDGPLLPPWPHPSEEMTPSRCATALGVSPKTMNSAIKKTLEGKSVHGRVGACAAIFARQPPYLPPKALCRELMKAAGANPSEAAKEPKERVSSIRPLRPTKCEEARLAAISAKARQDAFKSAMNQKPTKTALVRLEKIVIKIREHDGQNTIPQGRISIGDETFDVRELGRFATLGDWIAMATPEELRLVVVFGGRLYDYSTAPEKVLVEGIIKAMCLAEFAKAVLTAAEFEAAKRVGADVDGAMKNKGKEPKNRGF